MYAFIKIYLHWHFMATVISILILNLLKDKKEILIHLIEEEKIKGCTILGKPTEELKEMFFSRENIVDYMESKGFKVNEYEYERTDFAIYFPQLGIDIIIDCCTVNVSRKINKKE